MDKGGIPRALVVCECSNEIEKRCNQNRSSPSPKPARLTEYLTVGRPQPLRADYM